MSNLTTVTPPANACQLLVSTRLFWMYDSKRLQADVWLHGLHVLADGDAYYSNVWWEPATAQRLWLTNVVTQGGATGLGVDGGNAYAAGELLATSWTGHDALTHTAAMPRYPGIFSC